MRRAGRILFDGVTVLSLALAMALAMLIALDWSGTVVDADSSFSPMILVRDRSFGCDVFVGLISTDASQLWPYRARYAHGFGYVHGPYSYAIGRRGASVQAQTIAVGMPAWFAIAVLLGLPAIRCARQVGRRLRKPNGRCPSCGYDLRATSERCPECGHAAAPAVAQSRRL